MLQVARLAPRLLHDSRDRVAEYVLGQFNPDGGTSDRAGRSDLYYTVFGIESLLALGAQPPAPQVTDYLRRFESGESLDFVHLACLARCWAAMDCSGPGASAAQSIARRLEAFRSDDGGYNAVSGSEWGNVYHGFLALGAYQDLNLDLPDRDGLAESLQHLRARDGSFANLPAMKTGASTSTAAAVALMRHLGRTPDPDLGDWLLQRFHPEGGFLAVEGAPMPDLLSTATAIHSLSSLDVNLAGIKEPCLDFLDSLWTGKAFCGHWADDAQDSEYTYYALLTLGHLSLW